MAESGNGSQPEAVLTFEEAYAELEQTSQMLQQGQLSLDETLRLYERGSFLAGYCLEKLEGVELKIFVQLLARGDGTYATRPLTSEKDVAPPVMPEPASQPAEHTQDALKDQRELFE